MKRKAITIVMVQFDSGREPVATGLKYTDDKRYLYYEGQLPPRYPLPATLDNSDTALNWVVLAKCPHTPACPVCLEMFLNGLQ